jgi:aryl-alcohol dehydrogenase-like predicted oxidoreductase
MGVTEHQSRVAQRQLGSRGPLLSPVGIGAWAMGGSGWSFGWGPQSDAESIAALRRAFDSGSNWVDTAPIYGLGHSEEVVGKAVRSVTQDPSPLIFTKCGVRWDPSQPMKAPLDGVLEPASIRRECEESLRRLGVDHIDLYQFHWPDITGVPVEDSWAEMVRLKEEGKVRWLGVCNFHPDLLEKIEAVHHVDSLQNPFSLIRRSAATEDLAWCRANDTGFLCYSPLQTGILTESFSAASVAALAEDDWRRRGEEFRSPRLERNLSLRDALKTIAVRRGTTVAAIAIAWLLAWPGVTAAIVGARRPGQVDEWVSASSVRLSPDDLDAIRLAINDTSAGIGPDRPE